jgi:hypothetical protein
VPILLVQVMITPTMFFKDIKGKWNFFLLVWHSPNWH